VCLLNDWSARDVQAWEALPLGPFLAKNFLTTVSPWIVTLEALAPFRCALEREPGDPAVPANLRPRDDRATSGLDLQLEVCIATRHSAGQAMRLSRSSSRHAHWSLAQMLTRHTENGCNLRPGDLLGSGTQSGPLPEQGGSLLELTQGGKAPITLPNGETRRFLQDGDSVALRAFCERDGQRRIGFGECVAEVLAERVK